jgi:chorismate mutase/prephenate dehydratase
MPTNKEKLQSLRHRIDAIDESIHELIMKRTGVVEEVRLVKHGEKIKIRPAREAEILYKLVARHKGPFPKQELARIWRELIVATLRFEGPFSVAVDVSKNETGYWDLARDQYGSFTPSVQYTSSQSVVEAVRTQQATVGVLPMPRNENDDIWWPLLISKDTFPVRIMARLPFIPGDNANHLKGLNALVISTVPQEETGRDRSYLSFQAKEEFRFDIIIKTMSQFGLPLVFQQHFFDHEKSEPWMFITEVDGFIDEEGDQLKNIKNELAKNFIKVLHLGGYATPLEPLEVINGVSNISKERGI